MGEINDGGPAFLMPARITGTRTFDGNDEDGSLEGAKEVTDFVYDEDDDTAEYGMTLRDWFAGQALLCLSAAIYNPIPQSDAERLAGDAYRIADAMLAQREAR